MLHGYSLVHVHLFSDVQLHFFVGHFLEGVVYTRYNTCVCSIELQRAGVMWEEVAIDASEATKLLLRPPSQSCGGSSCL